MPWRFAIGAMALPPVLGFGLLSLCPETPVWYMQVGRETDAKQALVKLRGESNMDIVEAEFNRIALNLKAQQKELGMNILSFFFAVGCGHYLGVVTVQETFLSLIIAAE